jgi:hypothetical protein
MKKLLICLLFASSIGHAETFSVEEFSTVENMESIELDAAAQAKINLLIPRIARRFCHSKVRPTYVTISIYLVQVQWSLDRICGEQEIPEEETTVGNVVVGNK